MTGCAGFTPGPYPNFWSECVKLNGWGVSWISPYGPLNVGYVTWERNVECPKDISQNLIAIPKP